MLDENGGHVVFTKDWVHYLLICMGYIKRKGNNKAKIAIENFEEWLRPTTCTVLKVL